MNEYLVIWRVVAVDNGGDFDGKRRIDASGEVRKIGEPDTLKAELTALLEQRFPRHQLHGTYDTDRVYEIEISQW